jgi:serine/threonine-protein kinase
MDQIRYLFPEHLEISPFIRKSPLGDSFLAKDVTNESDEFLLRDKIWHNTYVINHAIKVFLEIFRVPYTESQAVQQLAIQANSSEDQIKPIVSKFLKRMLRHRILLNAANEQYRDGKGVFQIGQTFFQYTISKLISARPNVELYLAERFQTKQQVVIKILTPFHDNITQYKARLQNAFEREFTLMQSLPPHKNICQCHAFSKGESTYAILEYIDGCSLRKHITQTGLSVHERLRICTEALSAVAHLHNHDVLHGDIHSQNFLLKNNSQVKLIDFGLSYYERQLKDGERFSHGGIPYYMPPERITCDSLAISKHPGDKCAEVYQLGVLLYEILYGKLPFVEALTWKELASAILHLDPAPLLKTPEGNDIPEHYAAIVQRALIKIPRARYPSVSEMMDDWNKASLF